MYVYATIHFFNFFGLTVYVTGGAVLGAPPGGGGGGGGGRVIPSMISIFAES